jgi:hypothetical protein
MAENAADFRREWSHGDSFFARLRAIVPREF